MFGAIVAYLITKNYKLDPFFFGALLSFASGILFWVSVSSVLPLSRRLDPENKVCSLFFLIGLAVVVIASVILSYA